MREKASMIAAVAERSRWPRIWDGALECGGRYTKCVQALTRPMSHHGRGKKPYPYCDSCEVPLLEHNQSCTCICRLNKGKQSPKTDSEKSTELPRTGFEPVSTGLLVQCSAN